MMNMIPSPIRKNRSPPSRYLLKKVSTMRAKLSDNLEQPTDLGVGQGSRWLVHDEHVAIERERPRDLHQLLRCHRQVAHAPLMRPE